MLQASASDKCEFDRHSIKFLEHVIDKDGIHVDLEKTKAILEYTAPKNRKRSEGSLGS